jgi:aminoglycoside phosphotransferase (APT) family kinase protein
VHAAQDAGRLTGQGARRHGSIPEESEYVERYCERTGISEVPDWTFCLAFCFFRLAAILQGVKKRALDGNASSTKALEYGAFTASLAAMGIGIIDGTAE